MQEKAVFLLTSFILICLSFPKKKNKPLTLKPSVLWSPRWCSSPVLKLLEQIKKNTATFCCLQESEFAFTHKRQNTATGEPLK